MKPIIMNPAIEEIVFGGKIFAIIVRASFKKTGIEFFTPAEFSQQLGYMNRPKGYVIEPHIHLHQERKVSFTQEVLVVRSGKVRVDFYDENQVYLKSSIIEEGDVILLATGGHGFEVVEDAEMIEIKQGPYNDQDDKVRFANHFAKKVNETIDT
jgi:mannose-6-phosphate isomerase-like protein (cupin superfamily)